MICSWMKSQNADTPIIQNPKGEDVLSACALWQEDDSEEWSGQWVQTDNKQRNLV